MSQPSTPRKTTEEQCEGDPQATPQPLSSSSSTILDPKTFQFSHWKGEIWCVVVLKDGTVFDGVFSGCCYGGRSSGYYVDYELQDPRYEALWDKLPDPNPILDESLVTFTEDEVVYLAQLSPSRVEILKAT